MFVRRSVGYQLAAAFLVCLSLMAALGWESVRALRHVGESLIHVHQVALPAVDFLDQADRDLQQLLVAERSLLSTSAEDERAAKYRKEVSDNLRQSSERLQKYRALTQDPEQARVFERYLAARKSWEQLHARTMSLLASRNEAHRAEARALSAGPGAVAFEAMREPINALEDLVGARAAEHAELARASEAAARTWILGVSCLAALITTLLLVLLTRRIARPPARGCARS